MTFFENVWTGTRDRLGTFLLTGISRSLRMREENEEYIYRRTRSQGKGVVIAFWHNRMFYLSYYLISRFVWNGVPGGVMISPSQDGSIISGIIHRLGPRVFRGSSSRKGSRALKEMIRFGKRGGSPVITPDGPVGPKYKVQEGAAVLSRGTGHPIIPISYGVRSGMTLDSWDDFLLPAPFSNGLVLYEDPVFPGANGERSVEEISGELQDKLDALEADLESRGYTLTDSE